MYNSVYQCPNVQIIPLSSGSRNPGTITLSPIYLSFLRLKISFKSPVKQLVYTVQMSQNTFLHLLSRFLSFCLFLQQLYKSTAIFVIPSAFFVVVVVVATIHLRIWSASFSSQPNPRNWDSQQVILWCTLTPLHSIEFFVLPLYVE